MPSLKDPELQALLDDPQTVTRHLPLVCQLACFTSPAQKGLRLGLASKASNALMEHPSLYGLPGDCLGPSLPEPHIQTSAV